MKTSIIAVTIMVCSLFFSVDGYATPLMVCFVEIEHWGQKDKESGKITGIYPDIYQEFQRRTQVESVLKLAPYPRVMHWLADGTCDLSITLPSKQFLDEIDVGEAIWTIRQGILSSPANHITQYHQLKGVTVGIIRQAKITPQFDNDMSFEKHESVQFTNLIKMINAGRIGAIAGDIDTVYAIMKNNSSLATLFAEPLVLGELPIHFMMSKKSMYLPRFAEFNEALIELKKEGTIKKIVYSHLGAED